MSKLTLYDKERPRLKTGDAILWRSDTMLGTIIQSFSNSKLNHVSIVITFPEYAPDRVYVLEALEFGTVLKPLSDRLLSHRGEAWAYLLHPAMEGMRDDMARYALANAGKPYDYRGLIGNIKGRVRGDDKALFCSEYWWRAFRDGVSRTGLGRKEYRAATARLDGRMPRPGDFPMMRQQGIFKDVAKIL